MNIQIEVMIARRDYPNRIAELRSLGVKRVAYGEDYVIDRANRRACRLERVVTPSGTEYRAWGKPLLNQGGAQ